MSNFDWALTKTLHHEGGFVDNPADPGGATYRGVSLRFLRSVGEDIDGDGDVDYDDIIALKSAEPDVLAGIYKRYFWDPNRLDEVSSELLSGKIFDMAVNMGSKQAWKIVQRASGHLTADGIVGPKTLAFLRESSRSDHKLIGRIRAEQAKFYTRLIAQKPSLGTFALGWYRRAAQ